MYSKCTKLWKLGKGVEFPSVNYLFHPQARKSLFTFIYAFRMDLWNAWRRGVPVSRVASCWSRTNAMASAVVSAKAAIIMATIMRAGRSGAMKRSRVKFTTVWLLSWRWLKKSAMIRIAIIWYRKPVVDAVNNAKVFYPALLFTFFRFFIGHCVLLFGTFFPVFWILLVFYIFGFFF